MRQKELKKKLSLKKETVSQLNQLEMNFSKGGVKRTSNDGAELLHYTDPDESCDTNITCRRCIDVLTEDVTCYWC